MARLLDAEDIPYVALDLDGDLCAREREAGRPVYYGDASRKPILEKVGGARARAFVITSDDPEASERTVREIRAAWPAAGVLARARDGAHARRLYALGVSAAVPETLEGSLQLGAEVLAGDGPAGGGGRHAGRVPPRRGDPAAHGGWRRRQGAALTAGPIRSTRLVQIAPSKRAGRRASVARSSTPVV